MAWEWATEAGVGARVALRTIESTHVSPTSTCPHSGAVRCTPHHSAAQEGTGQGPHRELDRAGDGRGGAGGS